MNVREATENGEVSLISVKTEHQCADIFTKSLARTKFERFRETIRGAISYDDMVADEIATSSSSSSKSKTTESKGSHEVNFLSIGNLISKIQSFELTPKASWPSCVIKCNHYSDFTYHGRANPLQSLQECIEGRAPYAIPGY